MEFIDKLNWRYATKRMTGEKLSETDLNTILEAIRLAPTAYGLQPFKVLVIEDKKLLHEIFEKACPQVVINQCSHLLVFKAAKKLDNEVIDDYVDEMIRVRATSDEENEKFRAKIQHVIDNPEINKFSWTIRQTYIALGYATFAAALLNVDSTPIEGFNPKALNKLLKLDDDKEEAVVMLTLGFRDEKEDKLAVKAKIRKSLAKLTERG